MRSLIYTYLLLLIVLGMTACTIEDESFDRNINAMNLYQLAQGDSFRFVLLTGTDYRDNSKFDFEYTGDTLLVEVLGIRDGKYVVRESITRRSNMFVQPDADYYWFDKDSVYINFWDLREDSLVITSTWPGISHVDLPVGRSEYVSHLFFRNSIPLVSSQNLQEVEIKGWKTTYPYMEGNKLLRVNRYRLFETDYSGLTVFLNNEPMSYDAPGRTLVYDRVQGIVRSSMYSWWSQTGIGWDRLD